MGDHSHQRETLEVLREIRDLQRDTLRLLNEQRAAAEEQLRKSRASVEESVGLQRAAPQRRRAVTALAVPGILSCMAAIACLVLRYL